MDENLHSTAALIKDLTGSEARLFLAILPTAIFRHDSIAAGFVEALRQSTLDREKDGDA